MVLSIYSWPNIECIVSASYVFFVHVETGSGSRGLCQDVPNTGQMQAAPPAPPMRHATHKESLLFSCLQLSQMDYE